MPTSQQMLFNIGDEVAPLPNILLTLQPEWFELIVSGEKRYEYRRKYLRQPSTAYIYVGGKIRAVCARLRLGMPIIGPVDDIVSIREAERSGGGDGIRAYLHGSSEGFAIPIEQCQRIQPVSLEILRIRFAKFAVPQSYVVLDRKPELLELLRSQPVVE